MRLRTPSIRTVAAFEALTKARGRSGAELFDQVVGCVLLVGLGLLASYAFA